ncbi:nucleotidyltransferase domain-containing protein [Candidatus Woesearchaeota archaeon]|nr:nucleotidyltransferase domain-containing protein [Candidatus Woesearchaeota archaeon]
MALKQSLKWLELKKSLKKLLAKYKEIKDFIIFGSLVKGKYVPKDIDIALVVEKKDIFLVGEIKEQLKNKNLDIELIKPEEIYQTRLGLNLISEGFSIKNNKFLREKLNLSPMKIYTYEIKNLTQTKKVLFGRGLNQIIEDTNAVKLGAGSIMVPIEQTNKFEDFLDIWNLKYKSKEYLVL